MEEEFLNALNSFNESLAKMLNAFKALDETMREIDIPDYTIQENLASESILINSCNS